MFGYSAKNLVKLCMAGTFLRSYHIFVSFFIPSILFEFNYYLPKVISPCVRRYELGYKQSTPHFTFINLTGYGKYYFTRFFLRSMDSYVRTFIRTLIESNVS